MYLRRYILIFLFIIVAKFSFAQTFSNGTNFAIPDNNAAGTTSVIAVAGLGTSLNCTTLGLQSVCIKIAHTFDADLDVTLIAPDGTTVDLTSDNGAGGDNYGNAAANDLGPYTCFDMTAATAVTAGAAPFAATYRPEGAIGNVNNGQNPNGNWSLRCVDDAGADIGTLLYWQLTFATTTIPCPILLQSTGTTTTCGITYQDNGGSANYTNNQNTIRTICPATVGQCASVSFSSFSLEDGFDYLYVFDGNSTIVNQFAGSPYTGTTIPASFTATTSNPSGCLTFQFVSDGVGVSSGWNATISCAACGTAPSATAQDCGAGVQVCNDASFSGNSSGNGNFGDLNITNSGCLFEEGQSSWYYFTAGTSGNLGLLITPSNGSDDYDFAVWGPMASVTCPPQGAPLRCSYAASGGNTGMVTGSGDNTEGVFGNRFVESINALAGQGFILLVDNYSGSAQPFTLDWTLAGGATLNCTTLPIELTSFTGKNIGSKNLIEWTTASEINNDYFILERSSDGINYEFQAQIRGAGNSTSILNYQEVDKAPFPLTYYRLKQNDFNGEHTYSPVISLENDYSGIVVSNVHPNPTTENINFDVFTSASGNLHIQILDYTGRVVLDDIQSVNAGRSSLNTDMKTLAKGLYSLKVEFNNGASRSLTKVIKQ